MKFNILIEGTKLSSDIASGISNYIVSLTEHFKKYESKFEIDTKLVVLGDRYKKNIYAGNSSILKNEFVICSTLQFLKLILFGPSSKVKLFHSPYMYIPLTKKKGCINVLTIHDLINLEKPFSIRNKFREWMIRTAILKADHFICISEATKEQFKSHYPRITDLKISVIYQGIDPIFTSNEPNFTNTNLVSKSYLLYVGKRDGYKNFKSLLPFMASNKCQEQINLICVGGGDFSEEERKNFREFKLEERVHHYGYAENNVLKTLYTDAIALMYTSLCEGFGIPIIEAMACGCPVVCGNFSSMKEISKGHAITLDDFSVFELGKGVEQALKMDEDELKETKSYAQAMSWQNTALKTLKLYSDLLNTHSNEC